MSPRRPPGVGDRPAWMVLTAFKSRNKVKLACKCQELHLTASRIADSRSFGHDLPGETSRCFTRSSHGHPRVQKRVTAAPKRFPPRLGAFPSLFLSVLSAFLFHRQHNLRRSQHFSVTKVLAPRASAWKKFPSGEHKDRPLFAATTWTSPARPTPEPSGAHRDDNVTVRSGPFGTRPLPFPRDLTLAGWLFPHALQPADTGLLIALEAHPIP